MLLRLFLALTGLGWLLYGLYCFARPSSLSLIAGVSGSAPSGVTELRAMYGGLQAAVGLFVFSSCWKPNLQRSALHTLIVLYLGLGFSRLAAALLHGDISAYTLAVIPIELVSATLAILLLRTRD